jgi:hypothetical protein
MARVPEVIRKRAVSNVAAEPAKAGQGFAALSELARLGAEFVKPAAEKEAKEAGLDSVYRDENGQLQVDEKSALGGRQSDIHNAAAFSKYLSQRSVDMSENFTELARKYEFNPAGFKDASDGYIKLLEEDESIPRVLKEDLLASAKTEASRRFNGLFSQATNREYRESDRNTATHRDMLVDDYINLFSAGDEEAANAKLAEIEQLSSFRGNAPYISETPKETEAFLRGTRAAAKASRQMRVLGEIKGDTEIPDELRQELEDTLEAPDLSPDVRQKLYNATQGRLKGIDANAFVDTLTADGYEAKVVKVESGGKASAQNPNSSATGHHQFTKGTWLQSVKTLRKQGGAQWAAGLSEAELLEMRKDAGASSEVFQHFRANNAAVLNNAGVPVNEATEYMAHFFGAGGAVQVSTADPTAKLSEFLPAKVIQANPFLANMTATDAKNWAARKMTVKASDIAAQQVQIDQIEDTEVRAMASTSLRDAYGIKKRLEDASAVEYRERLAAQDDTLTEQEIRQDHNISDTAQDALVSELQKQRKTQIEVQQTVHNLADGATQWNPFDSKQRNRVDDAFKSMLEDEQPLSPAGQTMAGEIAVRTGFLPRTMFDAIRGATVSGDPKQLASSMEFLSQVIQRQSGAIDMFDGKGAVNNALSDYSFYSKFMGAEEAAQRVIDNNAPEMVAKRKNLSDAAKTAAKELDHGDLVDHLSDKGIDAELGNEAQQAEMMTEYDRLFRDAYVGTGDPGLAKNRALSEMSRVYGPNMISGSSRLMKYPPQNFYPSSARNPDYMSQQLEQAVSEFAFDDDANDAWGFSRITDAISGRKWVDSSRIMLMSDHTTREEVAAKQQPSYTVMFRDDNDELQAVPGRFFFDPPTGEPETARAEFEAEPRDKEAEVVNLRLWREHLRAQGMTEGQALDEVVNNKDKYRGAPPETN